MLVVYNHNSDELKKQKMTMINRVQTIVYLTITNEIPEMSIASILNYDTSLLKINVNYIILYNFCYRIIFIKI